MKIANLYPALGAALLMLGVASGANAKADAGLPSFKVRVHGVIPPKCSMTQGVPGGAFDNVQSAANTARAVTLELPFEMDCNSGFNVSLVSVRAGLRIDSPATGGMFAETIAYNARVMFPGNVAGPACRSDDMAGACSASIPSSALQGGVLRGSGRIALTLVPGVKPLLAGDYTDTLVMTLSPRLGPSL